MTYKEAEEHARTVRWKVVECTTENCWCRMVVPEEAIKYDLTVTQDGNTHEMEDDYYIVGAGAISKENAEHMVELHNKEIANQYIASIP